ncbi:hypothetical protein BKA65DRAFT_573462 [Rhexocercosporidium sp. MPI-PUGE-AT-0058]|nr:hypothetical protein BKA65DRAFT_573462 [Rhexocercosporidium sp. MPI-PUGE-AT-0058]
MHHSLLQDLSQLKKHLAVREGATQEDQDESTLQLFLEVWKRVPTDWKAKCDLSKENEQKPQRDRLRVDLWSRDAITVSDSVLAQVQAWDKNPLSFLTSGVAFSFDQSENIFTRLFRFMDHGKGQATLIQDIRFRIVQMGLHDLMTRLECSNLRTGSEAEDEFANRVQVGGDPRAIIQKVKKWATTGGKYASLSQDLGGIGAIICMPADLSRAKLERIPASGEPRNLALACLKQRGIQDTTKKDIALCYKVAEKIWEHMRTDVDSNILEHAPVNSNKLSSAKRKGKDMVGGCGKRRTHAREPFHQSLDKPATVGLSMESTTDSGHCNWPAQSTAVLTHCSGTLCSPASSDHSLATLAQADLSTAQLADDALDPGTEGTNNSNGSGTRKIIGNILDVLSSDQANYQDVVAAELLLPTQHDGERDFWQDMVTVPPPSSFWNDTIPPISDFWGDMTEIAL